MPTLLTLNNQNLSYPDPIHTAIVHFVIAMVLFAFLCDLVGYLAHKHHLFEVSFWNMFVASIYIFLAVIFGQLWLVQPSGGSGDHVFHRRSRIFRDAASSAASTWLKYGSTDC